MRMHVQICARTRVCVEETKGIVVRESCLQTSPTNLQGSINAYLAWTHIFNSR